jgi:hypothetical protein
MTKLIRTKVHRNKLIKEYRALPQGTDKAGGSFAHNQPLLIRAKTKK